MNKMKKLYGFRVGDKVPKWKDRFGRQGGRIVGVIRLKYCQKFQVIISNGDILTKEYLIQDDFYKLSMSNRKRDGDNEQK
jgi:hypothetical protein